jgi:hypothetical protein
VDETKGKERQDTNHRGGGSHVEEGGGKKRVINCEVKRNVERKNRTVYWNV